MLSSQQNLCVLRCVWKMKPNTIWTQTPDKKTKQTWWPGRLCPPEGCRLWPQGCGYCPDTLVSQTPDTATDRSSPETVLHGDQRGASPGEDVKKRLRKRRKITFIYLFSLDEIYRRTDSCCVTLNRHLNTLLLQWFSARQKASLGLDQWLNTLNTLNATAG